MFPRRLPSNNHTRERLSVRRWGKLVMLLSLFPVLCFAVLDSYSFSSTEKNLQFQNLIQELRCLVCQNQTLAESNAPLAKDLRDEVASLINQNKSDQEIIDYLVSRYGNFVLFRPPFIKTTYMLWLTPFVLCMGGFLCLFFVVKRSALTNKELKDNLS